MEKVKAFFISFLEAEAVASNAMRERDIDAYNARLEELNQFLSHELNNALGMLPRTEPQSDSFYAIYEGAKPYQPRFLFRIDEFRAHTGELLWRGITATLGGFMDKAYGRTFWARERSGKMEIFATQVRNPETLDWDQGPGDREFFQHVPAFAIQTERLMAPVDEEESMREYNAS